MARVVAVSVFFEVDPTLTKEFESTWRDVFKPAIRVRDGYTDCLLWREWPRESDQVQPLERYRLDIMFETEELRMRWATSSEHDAAFGRLRDVVQPTSSMRLVPADGA